MFKIFLKILSGSINSVRCINTDSKHTLLMLLFFSWNRLAVASLQKPLRCH